jgi:hypothetical protein
LHPFLDYGRSLRAWRCPKTGRDWGNNLTQSIGKKGMQQIAS